MNIKIRECKKEEVKLANKFLTELIKDEKQYDNNINENCNIDFYYENYIDNENHIILFAEVEELIAGYLYGFIEENGNVCINKVAKLDALYVEEEYRHLGIGEKLITSFKEWATKKGVKIIEVSVCEGNTKAKNLYAKTNFKKVKETLKLELN